ncbi:MAG: hypothetical protein ABR538_11370 [Candidatus Binatia bacterium]
MRPILSPLLCVLLTISTPLLLPATALAANGDCGQPASHESSPSIQDVLSVLYAAVGRSTSCDSQPCICDVNGDGKITINDALRLLIHIIFPGHPSIGALACDCPDPDLSIPCTSAEITTLPGSTLDLGWSGRLQDAGMADATIGVRILGRCSGDASACELDEDCGEAQTCQPTCDCVTDTSCEITGPLHGGRCLLNLWECASDDDCAPGDPCAKPFGPPLPLSVAGVPICIQNFVDGELSGTMNTADGSLATSFDLQSRVHLGIAVSQPCPRCGAPGQDPVVGDVFTCEGGNANGQACTVDGVHDGFGGTSFDCAQDLASNVSGSGLAMRLRDATTGTVTKTAQLPCGNFVVSANPTKPGSQPKCLDNGEACTSNADCRRCSGDSSIECTSDGDCTGAGACAEAPDQAVSCGFWCHCGFCDGNGGQPCFGDDDCPDEMGCVAGTGSPQAKPNDCAEDQFVCGETQPELCATTETGACSLEPSRSCSAEDDPECPDHGAGECILQAQPCFGSEITRSGAPSPLGSYCAFEDAACNSNADCAGEGDFCVVGAARPTTVAVFCSPATISSATNAVYGLTGPGTMTMANLVRVCFCGDSVVGCVEECDDGNTVPGDGCDELCRVE